MNNYRSFLMVLALAVFFQNAQVQDAKSGTTDTTYKCYSKLSNSTSETDKALLKTKLYSLLKSNDEKDWFTAEEFFGQLKKATSDSIAKVHRFKFPNGQLVRNDELSKVYDEKDPVKKETLYKEWLKKFPPQNFGNNHIQYDYARNSVSSAYAEANNVKKAVEYANLIETPVWKGEGWAGTAGILMKKDHLDEAAELYKKAIAISYKYMTTNRNDYGAGFAAMGYPAYNNSLAQIYFKKKNYGQALTYAKAAHDGAASVKGYVNMNYANILVALGRDKEAFDIIHEAIAAGQATPEMKVTLKNLYGKVKGSNAGYDDYMASMNKILVENIKKDLVKRIINKPAPLFTLKDVNGKTVSLQDYRGKTVILDFWATWCGPCKRSFPIMKAAVNKYQDNPNVQFLFIHTWEKENAASDKAKEFVASNNYPFNVLMDLKDQDTGKNNVAISYNLNSIPTKVVVDKNGNIRFVFSGFTDGEAAVEEMTAMIDMVK